MFSKIFNIFIAKNNRKKNKKELIFQNSSQYWEDRYKQGGTSGSGSYGRLAKFKAEVLNDFVISNDIKNVVEYGCGDGAQLSLAKYKSYTGFDVSAAAVEMCKKKFKNHYDYTFLLTSEKSPFEGNFDLAISLDVIYHLVENEVFSEYMQRLFKASKQFVIIYSSNMDTFSDAPHEKRRNFLKWINDNMPNWELMDRINNPFPYDKDNPNHTSLADFFIFKQQSHIS